MKKTTMVVFRITMAVFRLALSLMPRTKSQVSSATIVKAGRFSATSWPAMVGSTVVL